MPRRMTSAAVLFIGAALCSAALASPAAAQTFTPAPAPAPSTVAFSGLLVITSPSYSCTLNVTVGVNAAGGAAVLSRSFSGAPLCALVMPSGVWTLAPGPGAGMLP